LIEIIETTDAVTFSVRVIPRASRSEIVGEHDGALKVKLASKFGVSKSDVEIISGETSKNKRIKILNLSKSKFDEVTK
jgi:uncharacterized protein